MILVDCLGQFEGHKWNLKALWRYFEEELEMDWRPIWERIKVGDKKENLLEVENGRFSIIKGGWY